MAACGGIGTNYSDFYDPRDAKQSGPIFIRVVTNATNLQPNLVFTAVAGAMQDAKVEPATAANAAETRSPYSLNVLIGPSASWAMSLNRGWGYSVCQIAQQNPASLQRVGNLSASGRVPVLVVLCEGDRFMSLAFERMNLEGDLRGQLEPFMEAVFPPSNFQANLTHNAG